MTIYGLYHDEEKGILRIENWDRYAGANQGNFNEIRKWNDCWFICNNRKLLREKAHELKKQWILDAQLRLEFLNNVCVETKYK